MNLNVTINYQIDINRSIHISYSESDNNSPLPYIEIEMQNTTNNIIALTIINLDGKITTLLNKENRYAIWDRYWAKLTEETENLFNDVGIMQIVLIDSKYNEILINTEDIFKAIKIIKDIILLAKSKGLVLENDRLEIQNTVLQNSKIFIKNNELLFEDNIKVEKYVDFGEIKYINKEYINNILNNNEYSIYLIKEFENKYFVIEYNIFRIKISDIKNGEYIIPEKVLFLENAREYEK
jgi:hypothetical protein